MQKRKIRLPRGGKTDPPIYAISNLLYSAPWQATIVALLPLCVRRHICHTFDAIDLQAKDTAQIRQIVESLETLSGSIDLTGDITTEPTPQQLFDGTWKLIFSSAFNAGSRRVRRFPPGLSVGPVYQVIDTQKRELDNVLELLFVNSPRLPWAPSNAVPKIRVILKHEMNFSMSIVSVALKETTFRILDTLSFDLCRMNAY